MTGSTGDELVVPHRCDVVCRRHDVLTGWRRKRPAIMRAADTLYGVPGFDVRTVIKLYDIISISRAPAALSTSLLISATTPTLRPPLAPSRGGLWAAAETIHHWWFPDDCSGWCRQRHPDRLINGTTFLWGSWFGQPVGWGAGNDRLDNRSSDTFIDGRRDFDAAYIATGVGHKPQHVATSSLMGCGLCER